jgi:TRAP-type uncharacterized transport system substrate-binding protein
MGASRQRIFIRLAAICCGILLLVTIGGLLAARYPSWLHYRVAVLGTQGSGDRLLAMLAREWGKDHRFVRLEPKPGGGLLANARGVADGSADMGIVRADDPAAVHLKTVFKLQTLALVALVPPESSLETGADLRGRKLGIIAGAPDDPLLRTAMETFGINPADLTRLDASAVGREMRAGRIAAAVALVPSSIRSTVLVEAAAAIQRSYRAKGSFLDFVEAPAVAAARPQYPAAEVTPSVFGAAVSDPGEVINVPTVDLMLIARPNLPRWVASETAAALVAMRARLLVSEPLIAQISAPDPDAVTTVEIHPGVRAYLNGDAPNPASEAVNLYWIAGAAFAVLSPALAWITGLVSGGSRDPLERRVTAVARLLPAPSDGQAAKAREEALMHQLDDAADALVAGEIDAEGFLCLEGLIRNARSREAV